MTGSDETAQDVNARRRPGDDKTGAAAVDRMSEVPIPEARDVVGDSAELDRIFRMGLPPRPAGMMNPSVNRFARFLAAVVGATNDVLHRVPGMRAAYAAQLRRTLLYPDVEIALAPQRARGVEGFSLAFVSDLHAGSYLSRRDFERLFTEIARRRPEVVVLGGDLVNTKHAQLDDVLAALGPLAEVPACFAVLGNHERYWCDPAAVGRALATHGVTLLVNEGVRIRARGGGTVWLAGLDEFGEGEPDLARALAGRTPGEPTVLISHHPDVFPAVASSRGGVDVQLSGHTHGGQVRVLGFEPPRHTALGLMSGRFEREGVTLYVGRGVGATIVPLRVGAAPEVPWVRIVSR